LINISKDAITNKNGYKNASARLDHLLKSQVIYGQVLRERGAKAGFPDFALKLTNWTLAFFVFSKVGRFSQSPPIPERMIKFARRQLQIRRLL
jgi:hypothetical protein